ncbi:MAG: hypothetical protein WCK10_00010 [Candidatus Staskawiczbacteria bacterium]
MSYRKKSIKSKIDKLRPKKPIFKKLWFWLFILILITFCSAAYVILFYPKIQITNILISGNYKILSNNIESLVLNDIKYKIFTLGSWEVNSKSIILVNKTKIRKNILETFPIAENAIINVVYPNSLTIFISEKQPLGVFCDNKECYNIDQNGIIFEKPLSVAEHTLIVRQTENKKELIIGTNIIDKNTINAISIIKKTLKDNNQIDLKEAVINNSLRLNITTSENWKIYFDLGEGLNIDSQIVKLNSLLNGGISNESRNNLRYIDLRPKDRAIVCDNSICGA